MKSAISWKQPDRGIWEIRGDEKHFVFSKVLCWVAIDRAIKIAELLEKHDWADQHRPLLAEMHENICTHGWNEKVGAFVQSYDSEDLDAANLLMAEYGFIEPTDPQFISTVEKRDRKSVV